MAFSTRLAGLHRAPRALLAMLLAVALLGAACDGDDSAAAPGESVDDAIVLAEPEQLEAYRFTLTAEMSGLGAGESGGDTLAGSGLSLDLDLTLTAEGAYAAPDRLQSSISVDSGFLSFDVETIAIGDRAWTRFADEPWSEDATGGASEFGFDVSPASFFGSGDTFGDGASELIARIREGLTGIDSIADAVNGVQARRYNLSMKEFEAAFAEATDLTEGVPDGDGQVIIWLADQSGMPVRMTMDIQSADGASGLSMQLDFFDFNSDDIKIEQPA